MAFNEKEKEIINYGLKNGKTQQEVESAILKYRQSLVPQKQDEPGYLERLKTEAGTSFEELKKTTERGAELMQESKPIQGAVMSGLGSVGSFIRGVISPVTAAISPIIQEKMKESGILENEKVKETINSFNEWATENPDLATNTKNVVEILGVLTGTKAGIQGLKTLQKGTQAIQKTAIEAIESTKPMLSGIKDITKASGESISNIPKKIKTNIEARQAEITDIKGLPTETAQKAVKDGIDILDVKDIYSIPSEIKPAAKELADNIIKFAKKETDVDPIETVGKPIVTKIKELESLKNSVGQKLGKIANTSLGNVSSEELINPILNNLKKINGLSDLKLDTKGKLDFSDTVLTTAETASDRKAIQSMFDDAIKSGTGKQKHLLRQELFEILGGKKRSLTNITDTQEKAFESIRKGLSDVLETKNSAYKDLSAEYRKLIQPLSDMRKKIKAIPGVDEDILDMNAGLLARRLTSTSMSQGEIKSILQAMDKATGGNVTQTTESLQKLYNVLSKYYDVAPKTGFQGQVKAGVESAGITDLVANALKKLAGETPAVRQKAIEEIIAEIFK